MNCSLPGSCVHGIFQARILKWVAIPFSRGSSRPRDGTLVSCIAGRRFTVWATGEGALKGRLYLGDRLFQMAVQYTECSCIMNLFDSYNCSRQTKPDTDGADVKKKNPFLNVETRPRGFSGRLKVTWLVGNGGGPGWGPFRHSVTFIGLHLICRNWFILQNQHDFFRSAM